MPKNENVENGTSKKITRTIVTCYIYSISKVDGNKLVVIDDSFKTDKPVTLSTINKLSKEHGAQVVATLKEKVTQRYEMSVDDFVKAAKKID